mgnify:CR=1 FL=1
MPAYIIVMREEPVRDADAMHQYQTLTRQVQTEIRPLPRVIYGTVEGLEGEAPDGVVMLEFPSLQEAHDWYHSGDYQRALPHRLQAAKHRAFIVDGV